MEQIFTVASKNGEKIAHLRLIKTGKKFEEKIEVLAGLNEGDMIIVNPKPGLKDGYKVKVEVVQ